MKIKAAVLYQFGTPLMLEEVDLEGPQEGEVLVRLVGTGLCHTDVATAKGDLPTPVPIVLGHEGAGIVEQVGEGGTAIKVGDHVVLTGAASCGKCHQCVRGRPILCKVFRGLNFSGFLPKGERRLSKNGQKLGQYFLQSSFAQYSVVPQEAAIKVREDAPLETVCFLGCGGITGLGSVINAAQVKAGSSVAVIGCGTVGLSAVMAANLVGAGRIIAVDIRQNKLELARELGATDTIDATKENPFERIKRLGVDYCVVAVGDADVMTQTVEALPSGGTCIIVGGPPQGSRFSIDIIPLISEKTVRGSAMGSGRASLDIPMYIDLFMAGRLPLDKLVTRKYPLEEINSAFRALEKGEVVKAVIIP